MIKRIVMMGLLPGREALFLNIFEEVKNEIRNQEGCMGLEVLKGDHNGELSIWTISLWQSEEDLETYRNSALFQKTWAAVKPLFSTRQQAWTLTSIEKIS